jgi:hypothetical protein
MITLLSLLLAIISIIIMVIVAFKQKGISDETLTIAHETKGIGQETKSITQKLATDYFVQEKASRIFPLHKKHDLRHLRYKVVYPVKYSGKPLPLINQGDFYAIHVLILALGFDRIELKEIESSQSKFDRNSYEGNSVFICSPQANPVLNSIFPYATACRNGNCRHEEIEKHLCKNDGEIKKWLKEIDLPCWFIDECEPRVNRKSMQPEFTMIKKIQVHDKDDIIDRLDLPLASAAEDYYVEASIGERKIPFGSVSDYGIFARLTRNENRYLVVSGIHQYGTWIVADYLNNILRNRMTDGDHLKVFESESDFAAIIIGEYNSKTMVVDFSKVFGNKLWVKGKDDQWARFDRT